MSEGDKIMQAIGKKTKRKKKKTTKRKTIEQIKQEKMLKQLEKQIRTQFWVGIAPGLTGQQYFEDSDIIKFRLINYHQLINHGQIQENMETFILVVSIVWIRWNCTKN